MTLKKKTSVKKTTKMNNATFCDLYNCVITGEVSAALTTNTGTSCTHTGPTILVLNDQGGSVMSVSDISATLRAESHQHEPVICFEPGIVKREGNDSRFVMGMCGTLRADMGDNQPAVCYAIEGNVVDRVSAKNGKGWCEDISPTLNTQDRHAVCFQLCGDRDNPSVSVSDQAYCIPANPMSDRGQAVCYRK